MSERHASRLLRQWPSTRRCSAILRLQPLTHEYLCECLAMQLARRSGSYEVIRSRSKRSAWHTRARERIQPRF